MKANLKESKLLQSKIIIDQEYRPLQNPPWDISVLTMINS